ncbi:hypothetical protein FRC05_004609 [Tulasnella sp. 425]|nr:hypothetical protein FRC05_004609 [Tulasnella sp. 425]
MDIITPYNPKAFQITLDITSLDNSFPFLWNLICHGFTMGNLPPILQTEAPPNSPSLQQHMGVIKEWLKEELTLGHLEGRYTLHQVENRLGGLFRSSPLGVVEKPNKLGKYWIWGTAMLIASAPPGTIAVSVNIKAVFRTIPIIPSPWKYIVVQVNDCFFIKKCLPFGITTAVGVHGETVDTSAGFLKWMGFDEIFKGIYYLLFLLPGLTAIFDLTNFLSVPLHLDVVQQFGPSIKYIGFNWDITAKTVSLPKKKRLKYHGKLDSFL